VTVRGGERAPRAAAGPGRAAARPGVGEQQRGEAASPGPTSPAAAALFRSSSSESSSEPPQALPAVEQPVQSARAASGERARERGPGRATRRRTRGARRGKGARGGETLGIRSPSTFCVLALVLASVSVSIRWCERRDSQGRASLAEDCNLGAREVERRGALSRF